MIMIEVKPRFKPSYSSLLLGCDRVLRKVFKHERKALDVRSNSPIFLGNAGWYIKKPALYGAIYDLTMFKDYRDAIPKCHVDSRKTEYTCDC